MKVKLLILGGVFLFFGLAASRVSANEGVVHLTAEPGKVGSCFAASVFIDSSYRILVSCRNLPVAWSAEANRYVVWRELEGKVVRLGELSGGKLLGNSSDKFDRLSVTAESGNYGNKPQGEVMVAGAVSPLEFDGKSSVTTTIAPMDTVKVSPTASISPTKTTIGTGAVGALKGVGRAILYGFIFLLVVVGVMGFLVRRKTL